MEKEKKLKQFRVGWWINVFQLYMIIKLQYQVSTQARNTETQSILSCLGFSFSLYGMKSH